MKYVIKKTILSAAAIITLGVMTGCGPSEPAPQPYFKKSQIVYSALDNRKGQILDRRYWRGEYKVWRYEVRFGQHQENMPNNLIGSGGTIKVEPYAKVFMWEFELKDSQ